LEDKAWVEFFTPLDEKALFKFCNNIEILFRINPYLEIKLWENSTDNKYKLHAINHSQTPEFELKTDLEISTTKNEIKLQYDSGIKSNTVFSIKNASKGSQLKITDSYHTNINHDNENYLDLVDKSLKNWGEEVQQFLIQLNRWRWLPLWRLYKFRIWLPMKPAARRITDMLLLVSVIEIFLITAVAIVYLIEF